MTSIRPACNVIVRATMILMMIAGMLAIPADAAAQTSGTLSGRIVDDGGSPVAGATIRIRGTKHKAVTKADGTFELRRIRSGNYEIEVAARDHEKAITHAKLEAGEKIDIGTITLTSAIAGREELAAPPSAPLDMSSAQLGRAKVSADGIESGSFNGGRLASSPSMVAGGGSGYLGATIGGAKDIGFARQIIESGQVPRLIDFSPEGLYSEHDIPTPATECDQKLCLSLGYGFAPTIDDQSNALFVHLGMTSNIKPEEFRRPNLQLALVVDKSGSMQGASMEAVKTALRSLVRQLGPDDEVTLIAFNGQATLLLSPTRATDHAPLLAAIDSLVADGSTDIEAGLRMGFDQLATLPARDGTLKRLMLLTDAMPNVGRTDTASFRTLTSRYASEGIGLTAFGVGINFGHELVYHISQLRGGNYFFLETPEKIAKVFDTEFDYLVTPVVYDLKVRIATPQGLKLKAVYGLPTWKPGSRDAELEIPTVFLSSNRGAIILRYERDGDAPLAFKSGDLLASGSLSFTEIDGRAHNAKTELRHTDAARMVAGTQFYTHDGMRMAVALTNIYFGLRDACSLASSGKKQEALDAITRTKGVVSIENLHLQNTGLVNELALLDKLAKNIESDRTAWQGEIDQEIEPMPMPRR